MDSDFARDTACDILPTLGIVWSLTRLRNKIEQKGARVNIIRDPLDPNRALTILALNGKVFWAFDKGEI